MHTFEKILRIPNLLAKISLTSFSKDKNRLFSFNVLLQDLEGRDLHEKVSRKLSKTYLASLQQT